MTVEDMAQVRFYLYHGSNNLFESSHFHFFNYFLTHLLPVCHHWTVCGNLGTGLSAPHWPLVPSMASLLQPRLLVVTL